jgi:hypothetical protein
MRKSAEGETRLVVEVLRVTNTEVGAGYSATPDERRLTELTAKLDVESACNEGRDCVIAELSAIMVPLSVSAVRFGNRSHLARRGIM